MVEIRFHSLGGQGAVTLINLLAKAGDAVGKHVQAFPFFGAERRGAPVRTYLRVDDEPIALRSQIYAPDFLVVMESSLLEAALAEGTKEETVILLNAGKEEAERKTRNLPYTVYCVDATSISVEVGSVVALAAERDRVVVLRRVVYHRAVLFLVEVRANDQGLSTATSGIAAVIRQTWGRSCGSLGRSESFEVGKKSQRSRFLQATEGWQTARGDDPPGGPGDSGHPFLGGPHVG